ncbi:hypothetical protein SLS56_009875 [Neofusicoccum ribis]|uniref:Uncharacterized protein n=1 Tax=Neofusicoccum ribis TaxID=45134 RepID=A0ABR3SHE8_9PEZI
MSRHALEEASQEIPLGSDPVCTKCPVDGHCVKHESRGPRASFKTSVERPWADFEPTGPVLSNKLDVQALKQWIDGRIKEAEASKRWLLLESDYPDSPNGKAIGTGSMIAAIASVTEAISLNEGEKDFAVYSIKSYKAAKRTPFKPDADHLILGTRKELFIPISTGRWSNGKSKKQEKDEQFLARVLPVHDDEQQITVQWAVSKVSGFNEKEKRRLETELEDLIRRLKWWSTSGEDLPGFNHDWNLRCRPQKSSVQSAIHVVLNAWAAALDQVLIPDSVPTDSDYNRAFEFIYRAFFGSLSAELIVAFLRDIGWVDSTRSISAHRSFRSTCKIYDDLLENHVKEQFPQMYPELATSPDPNARSQGTGKDKRPTPVCNNCPVQGHCAGRGNGSPRQEGPFSAFWPEVADEFPCRFQKKRVKDLIELEKLDLETQRKVRKGLESYISAETMRQAISAVTEAISLHGKKLFALYDRTNFSSSSTSAPPSVRLKSVEKDNEVAVYGEQILIPISERHLISASACGIDCNTAAGDFVPEVTHYFLPGPGEPSLPTAGIRRTLEGGAARVLRGLQWFKGASPADAGAERTRAYHHTWRALPPLRTAPHRGRAAPVHLILAAWTIALGFQPPTRALAPAADVDDDALACQGLLDAATLAAALRCARWLPPKAPVDEARRFDQTARLVDGKALAAHCAWVAETGSASGPGPAFASRVVHDLNAEDARTGRWERLAGELRAERARAEVEREARRRLASGQVARRPGTSHWATELVGPFEVDEGSAVYGVVGARWTAHEVHEMSREDLARLFRNPPADVYLHDMKRLMVDAAELHFELKEMEAEEAW